MVVLRRRTAAAGALVAVLGIGVAACGSDDGGSSSSSSSSSGSAKSDAKVSSSVEQTIAEFSGPVKWAGPNDPVAAPKGKKITIITCGSQGITCVRVANGAKAAAQALGYKATVVDGRSQPDVWNQAVQGAVADKADGIVLAAVPPALVSGAIAKAKAAGIPVASTLGITGDPSSRSDVNRLDVAAANSAFIAKDSGGDAHVLVTRDAEFPETETTAKLYPSKLKSDCGGCSVDATVQFSLALASQRLAGNIAQALQKDPKINYVVMPFDTIAPFIQQGIRQAGKTGKVKMVGLGADPPSIQAIKAGDQVMSLGNPAEWVGWTAVDAIVRELAKDKLPAADSTTKSNYEIPQRYVTKDNLSGAEGWQGDYDYQAKFKSLWGVGK